MTLFDSLINLGLKCHSIFQDKNREIILLVIHAKTGAKVPKIIKNKTGEIIIYTRERPVDGQANKAIQDALSNAFGVSKSNIEIDKGEKSKDKKIVVCFHFTKDKTLSYYVALINSTILES